MLLAIGVEIRVEHTAASVPLVEDRDDDALAGTGGQLSVC